MNNINLVVMTSNSWRHRYVANRLIAAFNVRGAVSEVKRDLKQGETLEENKIIAEHDQERKLKEKLYFGKETAFNLAPDKILNLEYGEVNKPEVFQWVSVLKPDYIALFGTGIIKDPLLSAYENKIINMHLGLSPYYRGSATSFWPLVFEEPECVGVTVHLAIAKVDAGAMLGQIRPTIDVNDGPHDIGYKNIIAGADLLIKCIQDYAAGLIRPQPQALGRGKVFKHADFNAKAVIKMKENFANGMIKRYLEHKKERDDRYPILNL
jgi:methionyl-tRNA formyltransferase